MQNYTQAQRLKKTDDFSSVFLFRKVRRGVFLKIHYKPNNLPYSRLGLIVGKRIHKLANKRNYMKRVVRELFRTNQSKWYGLDIIVRVITPYSPDNFIDVKAEFLHLVNRFNLSNFQNLESSKE
ncbi:MAG: ribonuclease P protein component [Neisseriaceae bacterium]